MDKLLADILKCQVCDEFLSHGSNPLIQVHLENKILIIGQAPGIRVHQSGQLWMDKSGENLRQWLGVSETTFYESHQFGLLPMGFCYPGKGKSGDLPPRPECAPLWHEQVIKKLTKVSLTLLIGQYAQKYYLPDFQKTLTATVKNYQHYLPQFLPLPHPSPRNFIWQNKNPWFSKELLPVLRKQINRLV